MMKYEKPELVEISKLVKAEGAGVDTPDCANGDTVSDDCVSGPVVGPNNCKDGGIQLIGECDVGGGF